LEKHAIHHAISPTGLNNSIHNLPTDPILGNIQNNQSAIFRVLASLDQLAEQQNCYNEMMIQSHAQLHATLQQLVLTMQPYLKILSLPHNFSLC